MLRLPPQHFRPDSAYGGAYTGDTARVARRRTRPRAGRSPWTQAGQRLADAGDRCRLLRHGRGGRRAAGADAGGAGPRSARPVGPAAEPVRRHGRRRSLAAGPPASRDWHLAAVHRASTGREVAIAVIDSGVDAGHPDLRGQVTARENFVDAYPDAPEAHGTAVAGIIAARAGNGVGIAGIAPDARLMALRACWERSGAPVALQQLHAGARTQPCARARRQDHQPEPGRAARPPAAKPARRGAGARHRRGRRARPAARRWRLSGLASGRDRRGAGGNGRRAGGRAAGARPGCADLRPRRALGPGQRLLVCGGACHRPGRPAGAAAPRGHAGAVAQPVGRGRRPARGTSW